MALESIANSDALYHDVEHTIMVTLVGQEILKGKHLHAGGVTPRDCGHQCIDAEVIAANIERTRFPVPDDSDHQGTADYPGLVRAADLIGQLADLCHLRKF